MKKTVEKVSAVDNDESSKTNRRDFLRISVVLTATAAVAGAIVLVNTKESEEMKINNPMEEGDDDSTYKGALSSETLFIEGVDFGKFVGKPYLVYPTDKKMVTDSNPNGKIACNFFMEINNPSVKVNNSIIRLIARFDDSGKLTFKQYEDLEDDGGSKRKDGIDGYPFHEDLYASVLSFVKENDCVDVVKKYVVEEDSVSKKDEGLPDANAFAICHSVNDVLKSKNNFLNESVNVEDLNKIFIVRIAMELGGYETWEDLERAIDGGN
jgi:hypothetical protein